MKTQHRIALLAAPILTLLAFGCESLATRGTEPSMSLSSTRDSILVNESSTVLLKSSNTLGSKPTVTWSTSLGKVTPIKEGMLDFRSDKPSAIFTSDKPGTAIVTATLQLGDGRILSDKVEINVNTVH